MKYIKKYSQINEGKNIGLLYHFTTLSDAISLIEMGRMYSTQDLWGTKSKKHTSQISFTRDKFLFKNKPKGVSFGVRFVFDGNRLSDDFKISPVKFSTLWDESEEAIFTIGSWGDREKLKKHQIYNLSRYIVSIDLITKDIYANKIEGYEEDSYKLIGLDWEDDLTYDNKYISNNSKPKKALVEKAKQWFESKGYKTRIIAGDSFNKKKYIDDKKLTMQNESIISIFKDIKNYIKDFIIHNREYKREEFILCRKIFEFITTLDMSKFEKLIGLRDAIITINKQIKSNLDNQEYSEEKYTLADKLKVMYSKFKKDHQDALEDVVLQYYNKYNSDLIEDVEKAFRWIETSEWYKNTGYINTLKDFKEIFLNSSIEKELKNYKDYL